MKKTLTTIIEMLLAVIVLLLISYYLFNWLMNSVIHIKEEVFVPDIQLLSLPKALDVLSEKNLAIRKIGEEFNRDIPAGTILKQNPLPGAAVRKDRAVKVVVSMGGEVKQVPELIGKSLRDAEIELRHANLTLGEISRRFSLKYNKDEVLKHDPPAGNLIEKDDLVNVVISKGLPPDTITLMPDFINSSIDDAEKWADEKYLRISSISEDRDSAAVMGVIVKQLPEPDSQVLSSTRIKFTVGTGVAGGDFAGDKVFEYAIPQGAGTREIKIVLKEKRAEKILFQGRRNPGTKISVPYSSAGSAHIRVFVNDILVDEKFIVDKK